MSRSMYEHEFVVNSLSHHPDLVHQVVVLAWSEWGEVRPDEEYQRWLQLAQEDCRANTKFSAGFIALSGDVLVGSVALHEFDIAAMRDRSPWVSGMIIKREYRGLGVGRALLQELESFAAAEHVDRL